MSIRAYLAGPMSNIEGFNFSAFDSAKELLEKQGLEVISPADLNRKAFPHHNWSSNTPPEDFSYGVSLLADLELLETCSAVYFLPGWTKSPGALIEFKFASLLSLNRYYLSEEDLTFPKSVV